MKQRSRAWPLVLVAFACTGRLRTTGDDGTLLCPDSAGESPLRPLTPAEYTATVRELIGDPALELDLALDEESSAGLSLLAAEKVNGAAEQIIQTAAYQEMRDAVCAGRNGETCVSAFIDELALRAFRRPADDAERAWLRGVYDRAAQQLDQTASLDIVAQVVLQSPQMLYFKFVGAPDPAGEGVRRLSGYEVASRLSYLLWGGPPDRALLDRAGSGLLGASALRAEAARLLADPRARKPLVARFVDWLELDGGTLHGRLEDNSVVDEVYPDDSPALRAAMRTEIEALVERALTEHDGSVQWLLTTTDAYVDRALADLYGVDHPSTDPAEFVWTTLPASQRAGLFTRAGWLALHSGPRQQSPILRGVFLVRDALCIEVGAPPIDVNNTTVPAGDIGGEFFTVREAVEAATGEPPCSSCHVLLNSFGFPFEHYDAIGRWQDVETNGVIDEAVDSSADVRLGGADQHVVDAVELSRLLAEAPETYDCLARRWFKYALGRNPSQQEQCIVDAVSAQFRQTHSLTSLLVALVSSGSFARIRTPMEEGQ